MRAGPMEFPRCFKQLKELDDGGMFSLTGNDTNHFEQAETVVGAGS
jgi:hypothetical protein